LVHLYAPPTLTTMKVPDEAEEALRELPGLAKMPGHPLGQERSCTQLVEEEAFRWRRCR